LPADVESLKQKKAWDVAIAPAKSVPMNAFMLYMSGSGVQIFSMMVVGMLLTGPIKAMLSIKQGEYRTLSIRHQEEPLTT
jgi:hypothetical protein